MRTHHIAGIACLLLIAAAPAFSATAQQEKMKTCNADAKSKALKGDDRKAFMKTCLSASSETKAATNSQQEKMKTCNADAKSKALKGDDRKAFMKTCLSGK
jgi:hypothetical protein